MTSHTNYHLHISTRPLASAEEAQKNKEESVSSTTPRDIKN